MNINISGEVVRTSQLPKRIIGLGDYLVALNSSPLETSTVLVSDFVSFLNTQFATSLASLTDVSINGPLSGQALVYNGSQWVNQGIGELDTLNSVTTRGNTTTNNITVGTLYFGNASHYLVTDNASYAMLSSNRTLQLATSGNPVLSVFTSQNVGIGTTTDAGFKLDINGTARVTGTLTVGQIITANGTSDLIMRTHVAATSVLTVQYNANQNATSGSKNLITLSTTYNPTSGTSLFSALNVAPTINQTGTSSGTSRGVYINPTLTTAVSWRSVEWSNNTGWGLYGTGTAINYLNGNLLIGTTTDSGHKLRVNGTVSAQLTNATHASQVYYNTSTGELTYGAAPVPTIPTLAQVTAAGNTTLSDITVGGINSTWDYSLSRDSGSANSRLGRFKFIRSTYNPTGVSASIDFWRGGSAYEGILAFSTNPGSSIGDTSVERMRITDSGNVLIGTTTDSGFKLDVNGTFRAIGASTGVYLGYNVDIQNALLANALYIRSGSNVLAGLEAYNTGTGGIQLQTSSLQPIIRGAFNEDTTIFPVRNDVNNFGDVVIQGGGSERVRFKANGNVLIGTTTNAGYKLDVNGTSAIRGTVDIVGGTLRIASTGPSTQPSYITSHSDGGWNFTTYTHERGAGVHNFTSSNGNASIFSASARAGVNINVSDLSTGNPFSVSGTVTASSAIARGQWINTTLAAAANNDVLVGLDINPAFTNGAFTGVSNYGLRVKGDDVNGSSSYSLYAYGGQALIKGNFSIGTGNNLTVQNRGGGNQLRVRGDGVTILESLAVSDGSYKGFTVTYSGVGGYQFGLAVTDSGVAFTNGAAASRPVSFSMNTGEILRIHQNYTAIVTNNFLIGTTTDSGYKLDVNGTTRVTTGTAGTGIHLTSTVLGNTGTFVISPNSTAIGSLGDFTIATPNGTRLFIGGNYQTLITSSNGLSVSSGIEIGGNLTVNGGGITQIYSTDFVLGGTANTSASIYFTSSGYTESKILWRVENQGSYGISNLHLCINGNSTTTRATIADARVSFLSNGNVGIGTTNPTYKLTVFGGIRSAFVTTTTVHGEGNTLLLLSGLNGTNPGVNEGRLHIGYNQNDPELRLNSGGISVSTGKWTFLPQIWFAGGITSSHNIALSIDGMSNGVTNGVASEIIRFTQRNGQFANFYDAGAGLSEFRIWQQANSSNYIYLKPGQTSYFSTGSLVIGGTTDAGYKLYVNGTGYFADNLKLQTGILSFDGVSGYWGNGIKYETGQLNLYQSGDLHLGLGGSNITLYKNTKIPHNQRFTAGGYSDTDGITIWGTQNASAGGDGFVGRNLYYNGTNYIYASTDASSLWGTVAGMRVVGNSSNALEFIARPTTNSGLDVIASDLDSYKRMVISYSGNVGIGTTSPNNTAKVDITSTTQGFLKPRLTSVEKNAITTPATGLEVYDSTTNTPNYYNGTTWVEVASNQSTGLSPGLFAQTSDSTPVANTTVETTLISTGVGTLSVPANQFQVGASYIAYLSGVISSQNNATLEIHLRSNGFVLADTNPMTLSATTGKFWELHVNFTVRAIGAGGVAAIVTSGRFSYNKDSGNTPESLGFSNINNTTFDTTINNTLVITATWGSASPLDSIYTRIFNLYRVY